MNNEHIQALQGWAIGEEILNYIRTLEREYDAARKERDHLSHVITGVIPILTDLAKNSKYYSSVNIACKLEHLLNWLRWYK